MKIKRKPPLLTKAAIEIILKLYSNNKKYYGLKLIKEIDITYATLYQTKFFLTSKGLIECNVDGRNVYIKLTSKGKLLAEAIIKLRNIMK